jgi:cytochrome P450
MRGLSHKYGPLMMLRLGEVPTLVVSSPEAAQAITKTHDITFADRHLNATIAALIFDGTDIVFGSYGDRWRQLRKISVLELLSVVRVQSFRRIREEEVARFVRSIAASAGTGAAPVNLTKMISQLINDTFVRESVGSRCKYQDEYLEAFDTGVRQTSVLTVADLFPSSSSCRSLARRRARCRKRIERTLDQIILEKKVAFDSGERDGARGISRRPAQAAAGRQLAHPTH